MREFYSRIRAGSCSSVAMSVPANKIKLLVFAVGVCVFLLPTSVQALGGFGGKPANPNPAVPRSKDIFVYTLAENERKQDEVLIANNTTKRQTIEVYPTDADISNTGAFSCRQKSDTPTGVGQWVKLEKREVTLEAGQSTRASFTLAVPASAAPGEHNGCFAFALKDDAGEVEGNVRIRTRSAVRIAVTVPGQLNRTVAITSYAVSQNAQGLQQFNVGLRNSGNISADTKVLVSLDTLFGVNIYRNEGVYPVIAGNKYDVHYINERKPFWGGWYKASAFIAYNSDAKKFGLNDQDALVSKQAQPVLLFIAPDPLAIGVYIAGVAACLLGLGYLLYRYFGKRAVAQVWHEYTVSNGDTLQGLAEYHNISWRRLAKENNIKPPYTLTPGQLLKVPRSGELA